MTLTQKWKKALIATASMAALASLPAVLTMGDGASQKAPAAQVSAKAPAAKN